MWEIQRMGKNGHWTINDELSKALCTWEKVRNHPE